MIRDNILMNALRLYTYFTHDKKVLRHKPHANQLVLKEKTQVHPEQYTEIHNLNLPNQKLTCQEKE